jgi:hypothetical protein
MQKRFRTLTISLLDQFLKQIGKEKESLPQWAQQIEPPQNTKSPQGIQRFTQAWFSLMWVEIDEICLTLLADSITQIFQELYSKDRGTGDFEPSKKGWFGKQHHLEVIGLQQ